MLDSMDPVLHDPILDRLFRHLGWSDARVLQALANLTDEQLTYTAAGSEWTVAAIAKHLVHAAGLYASRLDGGTAPVVSPAPVTGAEMAALAQQCADFDARLLVEAGKPEAIVEYVREGKQVRRARSALLAQALLHASEHRAQIASALDAHGVRAIDLDALSPWQFGIDEGLDA